MNDRPCTEDRNEIEDMRVTVKLVRIVRIVEERDTDSIAAQVLVGTVQADEAPTLNKIAELRCAQSYE